MTIDESGVFSQKKIDYILFGDLNQQPQELGASTTTLLLSCLK